MTSYFYLLIPQCAVDRKFANLASNIFIDVRREYMRLSVLYDLDCTEILNEKNRERVKPGTKKTAKTAFGRRMDAAGVRGQDLAGEMDVHASTISRLRHDVRNPGFETMKAATKALGTDAEQLWPDIGA